MNKPTVMLQSALLIALAFCFVTSTAVAQDMAKVAADNVKVLLDNDKVRVLEVQFKAGEKLPMHSHPNHILYALVNGKVKTTLADGKVMDTEVKAGEAVWRGAVTHANEAITDGHVILVEMKEHKMMKKDEMKK